MSGQCTSNGVIWCSHFLAFIFLLTTGISIISTLGLVFSKECGFIVVFETTATAIVAPNHHIAFVSILICHRI